MFVKYPNFQDEFEIARRTTSLALDQPAPVLSGDQIIELQQVVRKVPVTDHVIQYTLALVRQTHARPPAQPGGAPKFYRGPKQNGEAKRRQPADGVPDLQPGIDAVANEADVFVGQTEW